MLLIIDNFDSFTLNLVDYFEQHGASCEVVQNTISIESLEKIPFEGIVLSPGPGTPQSSGNLMPIIDKYYDKVPILGICLGHQALGMFFGSNIQRAQNAMHGKISSIEVRIDPIFENIPKKIEVVRYHSLIISGLPNQLEQISFNSRGENMAIRHKNLPIYGLQFHPESILTKYGFKILGNWLTLNGLNN